MSNIFPAVTGLSRFEPQNGTPCIATFHDDLAQKAKSKLMETVAAFHANRPKNARSAIFFLEFPQSHIVHFRVTTNYEMPTFEQFRGLLAFLEERLKISFPELTAAGASMPSPSKSPPSDNPIPRYFDHTARTGPVARSTWPRTVD